MSELPANILTPEDNDEYVGWAYGQRGGLQLMSDRMTHFQRRAEAAEARAAELEAEHQNDIENLRHYMALTDSLEAQLTGAAQVVVTLTAERNEAQRTIEEQAAEIEGLRRDLMDSGALWVKSE